MADNTQMDRRAMLKRLGLAAGAAYVAPVMLQLSTARASGGSGASGASGWSGGSGPSAGSGGRSSSGGRTGAPGTPFNPPRARRRRGSYSQGSASGRRRRVNGDMRLFFRRIFGG